MRNLVFILSLVVCSCSDSTEQGRKIDQQLIKQVSEDPDYLAYQLAMVDHTNYMAANVYDIQEIHTLVTTNKMADICNADFVHLTNIRGGAEFKEAHCRKAEHYRNLLKKYPEVFALESNPEIRKTIINYFLKNSTEFLRERERRNQLTMQKINQQ